MACNVDIDLALLASADASGEAVCGASLSARGASSFEHIIGVSVSATRLEKVTAAARRGYSGACHRPKGAATPT